MNEFRDENPTLKYTQRSKLLNCKEWFSVVPTFCYKLEFLSHIIPICETKMERDEFFLLFQKAMLTEAVKLCIAINLSNIV